VFAVTRLTSEERALSMLSGREYAADLSAPPPSVPQLPEVPAGCMLLSVHIHQGTSRWSANPAFRIQIAE
jgi:hypothetical protein